jgi:sigma-B regulation protein RsbU (phosphoserine phosphatase)
LRDLVTDIGVSRRVLVVDDSRAQRHLLAVQLARWGYAVTEAATGADALALARAQDFDFVISDWMMPGLTGPELCHAFRALPRDGYGYFILLTSKSGQEAIATGLDGGADDFLTKPVSAVELRARLRAGDRILGMQAELLAKNHALRRIHDALEADLSQARRLQQSLIRDRYRSYPAGAVALMMRPSGHVGGDLVGMVDLMPGRIGLYAVDVAGHGVAAALMTARLAGLLSESSGDRNIALEVALDGRRRVVPPDQVAVRLNRLMAEEFGVEQYFTLIWAELDLANGHVALVQAGHPHPLILRAGGRVEVVGSGGFPIGLLPDADWQPVDFVLNPGDRLMIPSDGLTECPGADGELGLSGLSRLLRRTADLDGRAALAAIESALSAYAGAEFPDDLSAILFDRRA